MNIKIIVATHKPYWMPQDDIYLPLHVGKAGKQGIGFQGDDTGDNISERNAHFCELTGLYWAWKNLDAEYIGLVHYRRHFSVRKKGDVKGSVLTREQLEPLLKQRDVILPKTRRYYIETIYSQYAHTADGTQLDKTREIIAEKCPDYLPFFDAVMRSRGAHLFNMFIMKKELADRYCEWLFDILFELDKRIDTSGMTAFEARACARIPERLLDVWIQRNRIPYKEIRVVYLEPVNWPRKIGGFLKAKLFGTKYSQSW